MHFVGVCATETLFVRYRNFIDFSGARHSDITHFHEPQKLDNFATAKTCLFDKYQHLKPRGYREIDAQSFLFTFATRPMFR